MKQIYFAFLIAILLACNNIKHGKNINKSSHNNQVKIPDNDTIKKNSENKKPRGDSSNSLLGIWSGVGEDNAAFDIRKSTIFYPDNNKLFKYAIKADSIKIFYEDGNESFSFKFSGNDTLILTGLDGPSKFYRFKK